MADPTEVPEIDSAYSLWSILNLSFLDTTPHTVKACEEFTFGINLKLKINYFDSANLLRDTFIDWGERYPGLVVTYLDFAMVDKNRVILTKLAKQLHFDKLAEHGLFSDSGYSFNLSEYAPNFAGSYNLLARLRSTVSDILSAESEGVIFRPLEVMFNPALSSQRRSSLGLNLLKTIGASSNQPLVNPGPIGISTKGGSSLIPPLQTSRPHFKITKADLAKIQGKH